MRNLAGLSLCAVACAALWPTGVVPFALPAACLLGFLVQGVVLAPRRRFMADLPLTILHTLLLVGAFYLALLREPQVDLLSVVLLFGGPFLVLTCLGKPTVFNEFLKVLVAHVLVVGSAAVAPGLWPVAITAAYLLVACQALFVLSGRPTAAATEGSVRVRLVDGGPGWWRILPSLALHHLALAGLVLGAVIYLVVPRAETGGEDPDAAARAEGLRSRREARLGAGAAGTVHGTKVGFPREVRIGDIGRIKQRQGVVFEATIRNRGRPFDPAVPTFLLVRARAWDTYEPRRRRWLETPNRGAPLPRDGRLAAGAAPYHWTFKIAGYDARTLFLPQRPRRIQSAAATLYRNRLDWITTSEPIDSYTVEAAEPVVTASDLAELRPDLRDPALIDVPRPLARRLRRFTPKRKGPRIADAIAAIREHFAKEGFRYTLALPDTLPPEQDPIEAFLERKEGHCELYATAACFFLRQWGIPARVAGGVRCSEQRGPGVYRAYYRNAHAWVEIRCIGKGFVAVDFTPPDASATGLPGLGRGGNEAGTTGAGGGNALDWGDPFDYGPRERERVLRLMRRSAGTKPVLAMLALGLFAALVWVVVRARGGRPANPLRVSAPPGVPRRTLRFYSRWLRECARAGHPREPAQTPREFLAVLPEKLRADGEAITAEFERRRYG